MTTIPILSALARFRCRLFGHYPESYRDGGYTDRRGYWRDQAGEIRQDSSSFEQWDQVDTRLRWDDIVEFEYDLFKIGGGAVRWAKGRWWMLRQARRVTA